MTTMMRRFLITCLFFLAPFACSPALCILSVSFKWELAVGLRRPLGDAEVFSRRLSFSGCLCTVGVRDSVRTAIFTFAIIFFSPRFFPCVCIPNLRAPLCVYPQFPRLLSAPRFSRLYLICCNGEADRCGQKTKWLAGVAADAT